jgi:UDP-3-O-[3-hydroxymyristoyl] glucosamine N-acyltransferase
MLLSEIASKLGGQLIGSGKLEITGVNTIQDAAASEICFLTSEKHAKGISKTRAGAILVGQLLDNFPAEQVVVGDVDLALIALLKMFAPRLTPQQGIHPSAIVEPTAQLDSTVSVGPGAYISHGVKIGAKTAIGPNCSIGENTQIGSACRLDGNVVVYHNCQIGNHCIIQANATIGAVGFGYSFKEGRHQLVPHNGGVIIEDGVDIGANTCIDRAKFGNTVIGAGTKIDNLVQVAHNVKMGKLCLLAGQVGIAGSTVIGNGVIFAGHAGASDNVNIGEGAVIGVKSAALKDVPANETVLGMPPQNIRRELRCISVYHRLPELDKEVKQLGKKIEKLEAAKDNKI